MTSTPQDTHLGAFVVGSHLRHLRECQHLTPEGLARLIPGLGRPDTTAITALETGSGGDTGLVAAYLRAVDAGPAAADDFHRLIAGIQHDQPGAAFLDDGHGAQWRHLILEADADRLLLAASTTLPAPLRTVRTQAAMLMERPHGPAAAAAAPTTEPAARLTGCALCVAYREGLGAGPAGAEDWHQVIARMRGAAFDIRVRRADGPDTVLLLDEAALHPGAGSARAHAEQMGLLAELHARTRLNVLVVPSNSGAVLSGERAELSFGGRVVVATLEGSGVRYRTGPRHDLRFALSRSLDPGTSARLLAAAGGTLRRRRAGVW
ncbi:Scr1 family TA system antitoxin-like transcriptional regulator [Kitasatospora sp. NPDC096128]|uniref:Scr1 family TA system antitoxin-like transcriptional regulator n=1 Tax=Kitasatospora sp. NPDC096128 TaxID=3155547 RepID=UPI00332CDE77